MIPSFLNPSLRREKRTGFGLRNQGNFIVLELDILVSFADIHPPPPFHVRYRGHCNVLVLYKIVKAKYRF